MATLLVLGFLVCLSHGVPSRFPVQALSYTYNSRTNRAFLNNLSLEQAKAGQFVELGSQKTNQPIAVLIWGDSHAAALWTGMDQEFHSVLTVDFDGKNWEQHSDELAPLEGGNI